MVLIDDILGIVLPIGFGIFCIYLVGHQFNLWGKLEDYLNGHGGFSGSLDRIGGFRVSFGGWIEGLRGRFK